MPCASFVVQSSSGRSALCKLCSTKYFVKASLCKCICVSSFCVQKLSAPNVFFCKRLLSDSKSSLACRTAGMSWEELWGDEKGWSVLGWDENSWEEFTWMTCEKRWDEMRRAEMRCVKCEVWIKCSLGVALHRRTGHVLGQQHRNSFAQSTHARAWLAHGACKFYRWERSYSITLRQLPSSLVRALLVPQMCIYIYIYLSFYLSIYPSIYLSIYLYKKEYGTRCFLNMCLNSNNY